MKYAAINNNKYGLYPGRYQKKRIHTKKMESGKKTNHSLNK